MCFSAMKLDRLHTARAGSDIANLMISKPQKRSARLSYEDDAQEGRFTEYYSLQYRSTNMLLCILLSVIWCIRGYHYYIRPQAVAGPCLVALSAMSIALELHHIWWIMRQPKACCFEDWKGYMFVADLAACTVAVILTAGRNPVPMTTSVIVHTVHGWLTPFAGFRVSAVCYLHALNMQCFCVMKFSELFTGGSWTVRRFVLDSLLLFVVNAVMPVLINIRYEARQRSKFSEQHGAESMQPVWETILSLQQKASAVHAQVTT